MGKIFSRLFPGDVVKTIGSYAFRKLQTKVPSDFSFLDIFYDFKTVGNFEATAASEITLENQGGDAAVSLQTMTGPSNGKLKITSGVGLEADFKSTSGDHESAGFQLLGVSNDFAAGAKTIAFMLSSALQINNRNSQILSPNDQSSSSFGVGRNANTGQLSHAYAREVGGGDYGMALAVDKDYSRDNKYFAFFGGAKDIINKNVIVTCGSADAPSAVKIYIDGSLVAIFNAAGAEMEYMDLTSADGIIRCFKSSKGGTSTQDWRSYTMAYFAMTRGEMSEEEVKELNDKLSASFGDGNLSDEEGVFEGPLSKVNAFVASKGLTDTMCMVDIDGMQSSVPGGELAGYFESMGFVAEDIVRFEYPT